MAGRRPAQVPGYGDPPPPPGAAVPQAFWRYWSPAQRDRRPALGPSRRPAALLTTYKEGLHRLLTVCTGCNPCKARETYVNVGFRPGADARGQGGILSYEASAACCNAVNSAQPLAPRSSSSSSNPRSKGAPSAVP